MAPVPLTAQIVACGGRNPPAPYTAVAVTVAGLSRGRDPVPAAGEYERLAARVTVPTTDVTSTEPSRRQPAVPIAPRQFTTGPDPEKNLRLTEGGTHRAACRTGPGVPTGAVPTGIGHSRIVGLEGSVRHRPGGEPEPLAATVEVDEVPAFGERTPVLAGRCAEVWR